MDKNNMNNAVDLAGVYAASTLTEDYKIQSETAELVGGMFESSKEEISNNINGGAGFFAETNLAASYSANQANAGSDDIATRLGSHEFGSVDVVTESDLGANPKFYATAEDTYKAGSELIEVDGVLTPKYHENIQTVITPSDQLDSVQAMHQQEINHSIAVGDIEHAAALQEISFSDRLTGTNGISSDPLTYAEAQQATAEFRDGHLPDYAQEPSLIDGAESVAIGTLSAAGFVVAVEFAPALAKNIKALFSNEISIDEAKNNLILHVKDKNLVPKVAETAGKATAAGLLHINTPINAAGAAFLVIYVVDIYKLFQRRQNGAISRDEFYLQVKKVGIERGIMTLIAGAACSLVGPIGILAPILAQLLAQSNREEQELNSGLREVFMGWVETVNSTAAETSNQWQLAYANLANFEEQQKKITDADEQGKKMREDMAQFNKIIENDTMNNLNDVTLQFSEPTALIETLELEKENINTQVQMFIIEHSNNRKLLEAAALDAVSLLNPKTPEMSVISGNILDRLSAALKLNTRESGKIGQQLAQAQYAALRMLKALQNEQCLGIEFSNLLLVRINGLMAQQATLSMQHNQDIQQVYHSMAASYLKLRNQLISNSQRLDSIDKRLQLQEWLNQTSIKRTNDQTYSQMPPLLRLATILNEFIHLVEGQWNSQELLVLQEMLARVGLGDCVFDMPALFNELSTSHSIRDRLFNDLAYIQQSSLTALNESNKWLIDLHQGFTQGDGFDHTSSETSALFGEQENGWDVALAMLWHIQSAGLTPIRQTEMGVLKQRWLDEIKLLDEMRAEGLLPADLKHELTQLQANIESYPLKVPLIGKFSTGKSTLLNAWLGIDLQATDLGACTSIPTEIHYAKQGKECVMIARRLVASSAIEREVLPLSMYQTQSKFSAFDDPSIVHLELHLHRPSLARHPDVVLVDTPGLESNVGGHEQVLAQYLGESTAYILCAARNHLGEAERQFVERQQGLGQTVLLLVCQEDLINRSEREQVRQVIAQQAGIAMDETSLIRGCSAKDNELTGFKDILNQLESNKATLFSAHFKDAIEHIGSKAKRMLQQQLQSNLTKVELEQQKRLILEGMERLSIAYGTETRQLEKHNDSVVSSTMSTIREYLDSRASSYESAILDTKDFTPMLDADIQNAFQLSVESNLMPIVSLQAKRLKTAVALNRPEAILLDIAAINGKPAENLLPKVAGGATLLTLISFIEPVTAILTVLGTHLWDKQRKKQEAQQKVEMYLNSTMINIQPAICDRVAEMLDQYLNEIHQQIKTNLSVEQQKIEAIEAKLHVDATEKATIEQRLSNALTRINALSNH